MKTKLTLIAISLTAFTSVAQASFCDDMNTLLANEQNIVGQWDQSKTAEPVRENDCKNTSDRNVMLDNYGPQNSPSAKLDRIKSALDEYCR